MMSVPAGMEHQIRAVLPHLSIRAQAIVDALWLGGGRMGSATNVARQLGLTSRFALGRMLLQQGLPGREYQRRPGVGFGSAVARKQQRRMPCLSLPGRRMIRRIVVGSAPA